MASRRMTKSLIEEIASNIIDARFNTEQSVLMKTMEACGDNVYNSLLCVGDYTHIFRDHGELFTSASTIHIYVPSHTYTSRDSARIAFSTSRPLPSVLCYGIELADAFAIFKQYNTISGKVANSSQITDVNAAWLRVMNGQATGDDPMFLVDLNQYKMAAKRYEEKKQRRNDMEARVKRALAQFTTVAKAAKGWPEIRKYLPDVEVSANLPVKSMTELNTLLNLGEHHGEENQ